MKAIKNIVAISLVAIACTTFYTQAFDFSRLGFGKKTDLRGVARKLEQYAQAQDLDGMQQIINAVKADKRIVDSAKDSLINYHNELARNVRTQIHQRQESYQQKEELKERREKGMLED